MANQLDIVAWLVVGLAAGWITGFFTSGTGMGLVGDTLLGVAGGLLGGWLGSRYFGVGVTGINVQSILVAAAGSGLILLVSRMLRRA